MSARAFISSCTASARWATITICCWKRSRRIYRAEAVEAYRAFVRAGMAKTNPLLHAHGQLILGDDAFVARFQAPSVPAPAVVRAKGISRKHQSALALPLQAYVEKYVDRDEAIARAHATSSYTIDTIAQHFKVSHKTAARAIKRWRGLLDS